MGRMDWGSLALKRIIYRYSILGIPCGLLGLIFDNALMRNFLFIVGGVLCGLGAVILTEFEARRTMEKKGIDLNAAFGESPLSTRHKSRAERVVYGCAVLGIGAGLFAIPLEPGWIPKLLLVASGASCCLIWFLDRDGK